MFHFKKKDKDKKDKEKKDKRDKNIKGKEKNPLTEAELARLEEAKKGVLKSDSEILKSGRNIVPSASFSEIETKDKTSASDTRLVEKRSSLSKPLPPPTQAKPVSSNKPQVQGRIKNLVKTTKSEQSKFYAVTSGDLGSSVEAVENGGDSPTGSDDVAKADVTEIGQNKLGTKARANLRLPDIVPPKPARTRTLKITRQIAGDFGFTLRKGIMMEHGNGAVNRKRVVIFAEPGSGQHSMEAGLLPGDRLISVNGTNVEAMSRDEVISLIKHSGDSVILTVQMITELIELSVRPAPGGQGVDIGDEVIKGGTLKSTTSLRNKIQSIATEEGDGDTRLETDLVWVVHRGGFTAGHIIKSVSSPLPDGVVKVRLEQNGEVIDVSETDIERANPRQLDKSEDLSHLRHLNESSVLHTVRQRYGSSLIHTYAGPCLIIVNPASTLSIYSDKVIQMFRGCKQEDMPPHIYSSAQVAHHELLTSRRDQSIILLGRSGAGKTTNARHILHYLTAAFTYDNKIFSVEKLHSIVTVLEAFGNSRTLMNTNASRFTQVTSLNFDHTGQIVSASIQALTFDKCRVTSRPEGEPTFHIFYQLLAGVDASLRKELDLTVLNEPNLFFTPLQRAEDRQRATQSFGRVVNAMEVLGIGEMERKALFCVISAIYHLGVAGATKGTNNKYQFSKPASAQRAAALLGTTVDDLMRLVFTGKVTSGGLSRSQSFMNSPGPDKAGVTDQSSAVWALEGFVIGLYNDVFHTVVALINRGLTSNYRAMSSINIVDAPGFQNPATCGRQTGATFEDLCYNYTQERLQLLYHDLTFTLHQDKYAQENIQCDFEFVTTSPAAVVSLLDQPAQQAMGRPSATDSRNNADKRGLLWLLDEEAIFPGATEDTFMERLFTCHADHPIRKDSLLKKGSLGQQFVINHLQGTCPVQYNAVNWLSGCRERPTTKLSTSFLHDSTRQEVKQLFSILRGSSMHSGSVAGSDSATTLRRVTSMRRTYISGSAGLKRKSLCLQVKFQVDGLMDLLHKTKCHFIHCLLAQHNSGLCELKLPVHSDSSPDDLLINVPLLRSQMRGGEILDAVRIHRQGFPESMPFKEFVMRFHVLHPSSTKLHEDAEDKQVLSALLDGLDIDPLNYRIGQSLVFFRSGVLSQLEITREEKITVTIVAFQAVCRGFLGRKEVNKMRVQQLAVRCIQKNIRKYMVIHDWSWWRLYIKVKPLINVHRTEDMLKNAEIELEQVKNKLEKIEKERNDFRLQSNSLENRLAELAADLSEETASASHAAEILEVEMAERMRLEKELNEITLKYNAAKKKSEKMEMELMQVKLWQTSTSFDESDDDVDGDDMIYKERYNKLLREVNISKKQIEQEHLDNLEEERLNRKAVERRLHEVQEDLENQRRVMMQEKRKSQKFVTEKQDIKLLLEDQIKKNNELEKKQKRFDSELAKHQEDVRQERIMKEKLHRERDELTSDKLTIDKDLQKSKVDLEREVNRADKLEKELKDLLSSGNRGDQELLSLKRVKQELENKVKDQEEELDEQAAQIEHLQQTKLRLEMQQEKARQSHVKEMDEKETEMEETRFNTQKRVKNLENQLEEEHLERQRLLREKRELESKVKEMTNQSPQRDKGCEKRLKKDLQRTKALLRDAELMLEKQRGGESNRNISRQLRNQLEDAQFSLNTATKAKKGLEAEVHEIHQQMEQLTKSKDLADEKCLAVMKEKSEMTCQLEENEEDMGELMKKYKALVQQQSVDHMTMMHQLQELEKLSQERDVLKEQMGELRVKVENMEENFVNKHSASRLEIKVRDLELKLDYEQTAKQRFEVQLTRLKDQSEQLNQQKEDLNASRQQSEEVMKRQQRDMRDTKEELANVTKREMEATQARAEMQTKLEHVEADYEQSRSDLKLAFKRISDLQAALEAEIESDDSLLMDSEGDLDSDEDLPHYLSSNRVSHNRSLGSVGSSSRSHANSSFTDVGIGIESPVTGMDALHPFLDGYTSAASDAPL